MLHLGSALALLVGLLSAAAVNAQTIQTQDRYSAFCVQKSMRPFCATADVKVAKYDKLFYGFATKGPQGVQPVATHFTIFNNLMVIVIARKLFPNQAFNGNMRVTNDGRSYWGRAAFDIDQRYVSGAAIRLSHSPVNFKAPTLQDPTAGGVF